MSRPLCSVVMPAHNEAAVISSSLKALLLDARSGEFEVIVVCNGCSDQTAEIVREGFPSVRVIELERASKTAALNAGLQAATGENVLLLDADIVLQRASAMALLSALEQRGKSVAIGRMSIDVEGASLMVRAFYRVWLLQPYLKVGKFAAAIALTGSAASRLGSLPEVIADDTYLKRQFAEAQVARTQASFTVRVPRTLASLVRIRSRSYRGNAQLSAHAPIGARERYRPLIGFAVSLIRRPSLWPCVPVYTAVNCAAKIRAWFSTTRWERDLTSRAGVPNAS